ncbi:hypothetical protein B0H14DRAFT_2571116 [Mycena olivaceomarginata]|nr:hypothetical protein B0H14DRAFT_2571116 [Mycena olivaceomarginata]
MARVAKKSVIRHLSTTSFVLYFDCAALRCAAVLTLATPQLFSRDFSGAVGESLDQESVVPGPYLQTKWLEPYKKPAAWPWAKPRPKRTPLLCDLPWAGKAGQTHAVTVLRSKDDGRSPIVKISISSFHNTHPGPTSVQMPLSCH